MKKKTTITYMTCSCYILYNILQYYTRVISLYVLYRLYRIRHKSNTLRIIIKIINCQHLQVQKY